MPRLVIHMGTHKTATTHIQDTLYKNRRLLRKHGLVYPTLGRERGHHGLASGWIPLGPRYSYKDPERRLRTLNRGVLGRLKDSGTVFISSEEFSRWNPHHVDMAQLRDLVTDFDEVKVICALRTQSGFIQSVYQQVSDDRNPGHIDRFVETVFERDLVEGLFTSYERLVRHISNGFDLNEICLLNYENASSQEGGIVAAVLHEAGIHMDLSALKPFDETRHSNVSPAPLATFVANIIAHNHKAPPWLVRIAGDTIVEMFGTEKRTTLFSQAQIDRLISTYEPKNRSLEKMLASSQPEFRMTPVIGPLKNRITRDQIGTPFFQSLSRRIVKTKQEAHA
ncbi:hypothetical protein [Celeribacter baekdonensis]|uniref:hypothetical protein n=1 Tax=Celeribacter baekdonensis TaxID=875171 RepID=UPI003A95DE04